MGLLFLPPAVAESIGTLPIVNSKNTPGANLRYVAAGICIPLWIADASPLAIAVLDRRLLFSSTPIQNPNVFRFGDHRSTTMISKLSGTTLRRGCGVAAVAAGDSPNCAVTR